jgi:hypothetical protein
MDDMIKILIDGSLENSEGDHDCLSRIRRRGRMRKIKMEYCLAGSNAC